VKNGLKVRLFSKSGAEHTDRLPYMVANFASLAARTAVLDGELCLIDATGGANFARLHENMRTRWPGEDDLMHFAFDLLPQDGVDLQGLPLSERNRDLHRVCVKSRVRFLREVQTFPNGELLLEHCESSALRAWSRSVGGHATPAGQARLGEGEVPGLERG